MTLLHFSTILSLANMSTLYDKFDYPSYWIGREYEHKAEVKAISSFLNKIQNIDSILEIGAGYGRLASIYIHRAKKIFISDPSSKLLALAGRNINSKKVSFIHSSWENLDKYLNRKNIDLIIMVRVLHHINNINRSFENIYKLLKPKGYFILEFPNKIHSKAIFKEILKGNFTVMFDIFPKDIRSADNKNKHSISFNNYHPGYIIEILKNCGFEIVEVRSVSNVRSKFLKKHIPLDVLYSIEEFLQKLLSFVYFGPSTFVLARKK